MKRLMMILAKGLVSLILFCFGVWVLNHQSSAAFELGCFLILSSGFHLLWWPDFQE